MEAFLAGFENLNLDFGSRGNVTHSRGQPFTQIFHVYPAAEVLYTEFEKGYDVNPIIDIMIALNYTVPVVAVVLYMLFCYFGAKIMANYKPFGLTNTLAAWNLFLSVFSTYGAVRTVPHMLHRLATVSFESTVCESPITAYGAGACGLAVQLFIISKLPELIDTVFIVLRKKPLIFLHWYHHVTVLLFCWSAYSTMAGSGIYFVAMNYSVHALMYGYYCLQALGACPKSFPAILITISQILQMFIGTGVCISCWYFKYTGKACANETSNLTAGALMYGSYLYLFMDFAVRRYAFPQKKGPKAVKKID